MLPDKTRNVSVALFWPGWDFHTDAELQVATRMHVGIEHPAARREEHVADAARRGLVPFELHALLAQRLRTRGHEDRHAETQLDALGRLVSNRQVREIDVVDDLIAQFVPDFLVFVTNEMPIRFLVAPAERESPFPCRRIPCALHAKPGRAHSCGHSTLGECVLGSAKPDRRGERRHDTTTQHRPHRSSLRLG